MGKRRAFTLIELLVVIFIISLLVSILLPSLAAARNEAKRIRCAVNLRSFGMSFQLYMNDNKELLPYVLPFHQSGIPANPNDPSLLKVLEGYIDATLPYYDDQGRLIVSEPFLCPSDAEGLGKETGFSYEYWAGSLMIAREIFRFDPQPARTVTRFYESNGTFPVLADAGQFHKAGGRQYNQNALYFGDWRADWLELDPESFGPGAMGP
jgi:prepilin-type N-terminal cleavage/methylation domain-containing protein